MEGWISLACECKRKEGGGLLFCSSLKHEDEVLVHNHVVHMVLMNYNVCLVMNNGCEMVSQKGEMVESSHKSWYACR